MLKPIKLTGEQKKVLFLPAINPVQIKGVAGSGKTTVALYRAKHLIETQSDLFNEANVVIFTYNRSLAYFINSVKNAIDHETSSPGLDVEVTNFHRWAWWFLKERGYWEKYTISEASEKHIESAIERLKEKYPTARILNKKLKFYQEEINWIKGKLINGKIDYIEANRTGRGTTDRVTKEGKEILWKIYEEYQETLKNLSLCDFNDFAIFALRELEDPSFDPPYTHIVVDEAQDLNKAQILVISKLVKEHTNSITIIADAAQRIYKSGFTWSEVGINVKGGRTIEFKKNYRNTGAIALAAQSLLDKDPDKSEFTNPDPIIEGGVQPIIGQFNNWQSQMDDLCHCLGNVNLSKYDTVVLTRSRTSIQSIVEYLRDEGLAVEEINSKLLDFSRPSVKICTLSSIKGMEFDIVFIIDLNDDIIPYPPGFNEDNDEYHISTERRLLYTAMTRAKQLLFLFSNGVPSRYLKEIDENLIRFGGILGFNTFISILLLDNKNKNEGKGKI